MTELLHALFMLGVMFTLGLIQRARILRKQRRLITCARHWFRPGDRVKVWTLPGSTLQSELQSADGLFVTSVTADTFIVQPSTPWALALAYLRRRIAQLMTRKVLNNG